MAGRIRILLLATAVHAAAACGNSAPATPTPAPATPLAAVTVTVAPAALAAVPDPDGAAGRCRVAAALTFTETAGRAARVSALAVTIESAGVPPAAGWTTTIRTDVSIALEAKGSAAYTLPVAFDAGAADPSARWKLDVTAADQDGRPITVAPVQTTVSVPTPPGADAVFVGASDVDSCDRQEPELTARLLDRIPGTVFTAGDNVYPSGTLANYEACYGPRWGRHLARTVAVPGNHDYYADRGASYFAYFGPAGLGYSSFTLGAWHVIMMNSQLTMRAGSAQHEWLRQDLAASNAACTIAVWHDPLFSSGENGNSPFVRDAWRLLVEAGADVVVNGHDHTYERFAPQDENGRANARGLRQFVVGTGGYPLYSLGTRQPNSQVFENHTFGVLKLTLKAGSYDWEFVPIDGQSFRDAGSGPCVAPAPR